MRKRGDGVSVRVAKKGGETRGRRERSRGEKREDDGKREDGEKSGIDREETE
jgi:hypothetical protein